MTPTTPMTLRLALTAIGRGLRKKCPHCGRGPLFTGWAHHLPRCPVCGLIYERNPGDTWAFTVIGDRIPVGIGVVLLYFGFGRAHHAMGYAALAVLVGLLIWTSPNRWGVGIALHYLSRIVWPDQADPIPGQPVV